MEYKALGKITAPVGIKGEMRVYSYLNELARFSDIGTVYIDENPKKLLASRLQNDGMAVIRLEGIDDRNAAEALRGKELFVSKDSLKDIPKDTYFTDDLVGMTLIDGTGRVIGSLKQVVSRPAQDLYLIEKADGGEFLLPAVKQFIKEVNTENRQMKVELIEGLEEL